MKRRLSAQPGEWIDRTQPLEFRFEGEAFSGFAGDVIASALLANGVQTMGRSFKYHRPRGAYSLAGHDANALFTDGDRTHLRGDGEPLAAGMDLRAVNTIGGLKGDLLKWLEILGRFHASGFLLQDISPPSVAFPFPRADNPPDSGLGSDQPRPSGHG